MRKRIAFLFILFFNQISINAQSLEGEWKGSFTQSLGYYSHSTYEIIIILKKINENSYEVYSKTIVTVSKNKFDTTICIVYGDFNQNSGLHLKDTKVVKDYDPVNSRNSTDCLMDMELSLLFNKKEEILQLSGYWTTVHGECGSGPINITKAQ